MESRRYWQNFGEMAEQMIINGQERGLRSLECQGREEDGCGMITYGGRLMSLDVYLKVPTYIRRGITIAA